MKQRAKKERWTVTCCWICGKVGGGPFTLALRALGYEIAPGNIGHAHVDCVKAELAKEHHEA